MHHRGITVVTGLLVVGLGLLAILAPYVPLGGSTLTALLPLGVVAMGVAGLLASRSRRGPDPE